MNRKLSMLFASILTLSIGIVPTDIHARHHSKKRGHHWNWKKIDTNNLHFPANFLWGSATSSQQVEGNAGNNSWTAWENSCDQFGNPHVKEKTGIACDHWTRYKEDIALMQQLGLNTHRFSLDWSKVEPEQGVFDQVVLDHYKDVCREMVAHGIRPVITLHHYVEPLWFFNNGSFENKANTKYFVEFCQRVFAELHEYVHLWFTFNSACSTAAHRYLDNSHPVPPYNWGRKNNIEKAVHLMGNLLETHVEVYHALKQMPGGQSARIGILKNIFQLDSHHPLAIHDHIKSYFGKKLVDEPMYRFFTTGYFSVHIPSKVKESRPFNPRAQHSLDFVGLNYYSHGTLKHGKIIRSSREIPVDNAKYSVYAEGFYRAIRQLSDRVAKPLNIPIYVTENGISTADESIRQLFFQRYLYALSLAIEDGHDVRGYITWSFMDNYSWGTYQRTYGLISVDRTTLARGPVKPGAQYYINTIKRFA